MQREALLGLSATRLSKTCFPFDCSKVCIRSHEAQTIRQQHDTINQNQTSKRVFVGTSKRQCASEGEAPADSHRLSGGWGEAEGSSVRSQKMHTKWHFTN